MELFNFGKTKEEEKKTPACACSCGCAASEEESITNDCCPCLLYTSTILELSKSVALNKNKLQKAFQLTEGKSIGEYIRALRMALALELLDVYKRQCLHAFIICSSAMRSLPKQRLSRMVPRNK